MGRHSRVRLRRSLAITGAAVVTGAGLTTAGVVRGLTAPAAPAAVVAAAAPVPPAPAAGPARGSGSAPPAAGPARERGTSARSAAGRPATAPGARVTAPGPAGTRPPLRPAPPAGPRTTTGGTGTGGTGDGGPAADATVAERLLAHVNAARAAQGRPALRLDARLSRVAAAHSAAMAGGCGMAHRCPGEASLGDRLTAAGVTWRAAGENVGRASAGPGDDALVRAADGLTDAMLAETPPADGHRRNLLGTGFDRIGLGVVRDGSGVVWLTQDFAG